MNSRQRFLETLRFGKPDRPPLFLEGIREEVLSAWRSQGLPTGSDPLSIFIHDDIEEIAPDLDPRRESSLGSSPAAHLASLRARLDPYDPQRLPSDWTKRVRAWRDRQHALLLRIHDGYFLSMGVEGWDGFTRSLLLLVDQPDYVHERLAIQAEFSAALADRILEEVDVDGVIFHEPIADQHGPLISPHMYASFVLKSYQPIMQVLESHQVPAIIFRSYANPHPLLPVLAQTPINCIWACEANPTAMDYLSIREQFGLCFCLIGGIDTSVLNQDKETIRLEVETKVPALMEQGGFIPLADGRVREYIPFENYSFYRRCLERVVLQQE